MTPPRRMWQRDADGRIVRAPSPVPAVEEPSGEAAPTPASSRPARARLGLALRLGARDTYDYLGMVVVMSLVWSAALLLAAAGARTMGAALLSALSGRPSELVLAALTLLGLSVVTGPLLAGFFRYGRNAAARDEPELFDLAWGFRCALKSSWLLAAAQLLGGGLMAGNALFYVTRKHPLAMVAGALFGYLLLFWGAMALYQWPLLAHQPEGGAAGAVRKSALLVLDNLAYTLVLGLLALALTAVCWLTLVPGLLLWAGVMTLLLTQAARELLRRYGVLPPDTTLDPVANETHDTGAFGWHE